MKEKQALHHNHEKAHECGNLSTELFTHFPYAVFSVALSFIIVAFLDYFSVGVSSEIVNHGAHHHHHSGAHVLFHTFHFLHIVFAATGGMLTYFRFSKRIIPGIIVSSISTIIFCVLSDVLLPYVGGKLLGVPMTLHICFLRELSNVLPFLIIGLFNGWVLSKHDSGMHSFYSIWSHFAHIFVSSIASLLYMVSHGMTQWPAYMGIIFILLIVAVVFPCTMSDVVVPMYFAKAGKNR